MSKLDEVLGFMRQESMKADTGKIAEGTVYHFYEGRKQDENGHWQGNKYFYWQKVYRDPDTGKRIRKGGKAFATCPDEARKQQFLRDTGRTIEPDTGRLQKVQRDTGRVSTQPEARYDVLQRRRDNPPMRPT